MMCKPIQSADVIALLRTYSPGSGGLHVIVVDRNGHSIKTLGTQPRVEADGYA